jgi:hypothetical protein
MMKKFVFTLLLVCLLSLGIQMVWCNAEGPIKILTAYATSSSVDSKPIVTLLDTSQKGSWKPQTRDAGSNEGLFFQFTTPVTIDWIEVKVKNGAAAQNYLSYYLDGKRNVSRKINKKASKDTGEFDSGQPNRMEYWVASKDEGKDRTFILAARGQGYSSDDYGMLNASIKSLYLRMYFSKVTPEIVSIRFFRNDVKGPLPVVTPKFVTGKVTVTSTLSPQTAYGFENLFDSKTDFAWATDGKKTDGIGETIQIKLDTPQKLSGFKIWNGYQRSDTHYYANSRLAKLSITINDEPEFLVTVSDKMDAQDLRFPKVYESVNKISIKITDIHKGKTYKDLVVSELKMLDENGNTIILSVPPVKMNITGTLLPRLMDITIEPYMLGVLREKDPSQEYYSSASGAAYNYPHKSIRLRSNGSFVAYINDNDIMEGNWEPLADGIRIFGKKYATYYSNSIYMESTNQTSTVAIFQDVIKIIDMTKLPYNDAKKYFKTILAERQFYEIYAENPGLCFWWLGVEPFGSIKIDGKSEEELLKTCYGKAVERKAFLLVSPMFTDLFLPGEQTQQAYNYEEGP